MDKGKLTQNGVHLQDHEFATVRVLLNAGFDVELIPPSQIHGLPMPDIMLQTIPWEIKAPEGDGKNTIKHNLQNAARQSNNVILDLRRCKLNQDKAIKTAIQHFEHSRRLRHMKIVTKDEKILDFSK